MLRSMSPNLRSPITQNRYDVVIAGARCAGASTAMLLARQGLRVLVVDPASRGSDTLSTSFGGPSGPDREISSALNF